jgi:hypothetical protein
MDLLTKVIVYAAVLVVALVAITYGLQAFAGSGRALSETQASENITHYLNMIYPGANVTITDIKPSVYAGSWHVLASVVENASTPCPAYQTYTFDYPAFGLVNGTDNKYTAANCTVYNYEPGDQVGSAPVAVTLASNLSNIKQYINSFGFANVETSAVAYNETTWQVMYSSPLSSNAVYVLLAQNSGNVIAVFNVSR